MHCACAASAGLREDLSLTIDDGPYETSSCFGWSGTKHTALKTELNRLIYGVMWCNPLQRGTELNAFLTTVFSYLADIPLLLCMGAQCRAPCWEGEAESAALMQTRGTWAFWLSRPGVNPSPSPPSFAIILHYGGTTSEGKNNDKSAFNLCVQPFCKTTLMVLVLIGSAGTILALSSH